MNVRFFYNDETLELIDFRDFQGGYDAIAPDPPIIITSESAGPALFNFDGPAEFINGAIQLVNTSAPDILLSPDVWSKIFQICFTVDDQSVNNLDTFCPPIVWDLEQDPANGGFLSGDDGVVITVLDINGQSIPADESVVQFNWEYIGTGDPPYGQPVEIICSNVNCLLPLQWLSFTGRRIPSGHLLTWQTTSEQQVDGFDIERSHNGFQWSVIGNLKSLQTDDNIHTYTFLDGVPWKGYNYYRVKEYDFSGAEAYSPMLRILASITDNKEVKVFPNPATSGRIRIFQLEGTLEGSIIRIFGSDGQLILETISQEAEIETDISSLPKGIYLIGVQQSQIFTYNKFVIY